MCGTHSVDIWRLCGQILSLPSVSEFLEATSLLVLASRTASFCHPGQLDATSRLNSLVLVQSFWLGALSSPGLFDAIGFCTVEELVETVKARFNVGFDFATNLSSLFSSCILFAIVSVPLVELKFWEQQSLRRPRLTIILFWITWWWRSLKFHRSIVTCNRFSRILISIWGPPRVWWGWRRHERRRSCGQIHHGSRFGCDTFFSQILLSSFRHRCNAGSRAKMANIEQSQQMIPFITCEIPFGQDVCELVFGVNVFDLDFGVQINSIEQPIKSNSVGSGYVFHCWTLAFDDDSNHCIVVLKNKQYRAESRRLRVRRNIINITQIKIVMLGWNRGLVFGCACLMWYYAKSFLVLDLCRVDIVQSDHAPEAGVAQGIFHGILVRHQGKHQEEVEEGLEEEVERRERRDHSSNQTQVRMHGWHGMTHKARLEPKVRCMNACTTTHLNAAHRAQWCAVVTSVWVMALIQFVAVCSRLLKLCIVKCSWISGAGYTPFTPPVGDGRLPSAVTDLFTI